MAHKVEMQNPSLPLGKADVKFSVQNNGKTIGALHVSRGSVVWFPAHHNYGHKLTWTKLAKLLEEHGQRPSEKR